MFEVKILCDSISPDDVRLTTAQMTFPRSILAELNTHGMLRRNAASSRAIPPSKLIKMLEDDPFIPDFRLNQKGMQAGEQLSVKEATQAREFWLQFRNQAINNVSLLSGLNIHKQYVNRLLEPWMYCTVIITGTDWNNMFWQRCHEAAEPSFQWIAFELRKQMEKSTPIRLGIFDWHLALIYQPEPTLPTWVELGEYLLALPDEKKLKVPVDSELRDIYALYPWQLISAGRCCKVSYLNLDTQKVDLLNDLRLGLSCCTNSPGHWSPLEHQAKPALPEDMTYRIDQLKVNSVENTLEGWEEKWIVPEKGEVGYCGPYKGWKQFRKCFKDENHTD